jgi:hypothetical protein
MKITKTRRAGRHAPRATRERGAPLDRWEISKFEEAGGCMASQRQACGGEAPSPADTIRGRSLCVSLAVAAATHRCRPVTMERNDARKTKLTSLFQAYGYKWAAYFYKGPQNGSRSNFLRNRNSFDPHVAQGATARPAPIRQPAHRWVAVERGNGGPWQTGKRR